MKQRIYDAWQELKGFGLKSWTAVERRRWHKKKMRRKIGRASRQRNHT